MAVGSTQEFLLFKTLSVGSTKSEGSMNVSATEHSALSSEPSSERSRVHSNSRIFRRRDLKGRNMSDKSPRSRQRGPLGKMRRPETMARRGIVNIRAGSQLSTWS